FTTTFQQEALSQPNKHKHGSKCLFSVEIFFTIDRIHYETLLNLFISYDVYAYLEMRHVLVHVAYEEDALVYPKLSVLLLLKCHFSEQIYGSNVSRIELEKRKNIHEGCEDNNEIRDAFLFQIGDQLDIDYFGLCCQ
ncbi:hypothetical protein ACJX0J_026097, partial [Zea mays]